MSSWLSRREYIARLRKKGVENMHFPTFPMPMGIFPHKHGEYAPPIWGKVPTMAVSYTHLDVYKRQDGTQYGRGVRSMPQLSVLQKDLMNLH